MMGLTDLAGRAYRMMPLNRCSCNAAFGNSRDSIDPIEENWGYENRERITIHRIG